MRYDFKTRYDYESRAHVSKQSLTAELWSTANSERYYRKSVAVAHPTIFLEYTQEFVTINERLIAELGKYISKIQIQAFDDPIDYHILHLNTDLAVVIPLNCSVDSFYISKLVTCAESNDNKIVVFIVINAFLGKNW